MKCLLFSILFVLVVISPIEAAPGSVLNCETCAFQVIVVLSDGQQFRDANLLPGAQLDFDVPAGENVVSITINNVICAPPPGINQVCSIRWWFCPDNLVGIGPNRWKVKP